MRTAYRLRVINTGVLESRFFPQLCCARARDLYHLGFCAEVQTTGRTGFDASRFESLAHPIRTERALKNLLRPGIEFWNIKGAARDAITAADAVVLLKIDDAVLIFNNRSISRTCP